MKLSLILTIISVFFIVVSCTPAKKESNQQKQIPVLPQQKEQTAPVVSKTSPLPAEESTQQPSGEQSTAEVMLNPPHGEPFHRCDIPVGAPLNSPPANTTRSAATTQPQAAAPQISAPAPTTSNNPTAPTIENAMRLNSSSARSTAAPPTGTKPRLNPPHGQPWHRCDIAVGSPLP